MTKTQPTPPVKEAVEAAPILVTSTADVEFPSLGWSIRAGETKPAPVDEAAQQAILSNNYIQLTNKN